MSKPYLSNEEITKLKEKELKDEQTQKDIFETYQSDKEIKKNVF